MAKSTQNREPLKTKAPYRRRSSRLQKLSFNKHDLVDHTTSTITENLQEHVQEPVDKEMVVDDSEEVSDPFVEQDPKDHHLQLYILENTNTEDGVYDRQALYYLWKNRMQHIINESKETDEKRRRALCVVRQAASCLQIDLGSTIPIPTHFNRIIAEPNFAEVMQSIPPLPKELITASPILWGKWGATKNLLDLVYLAEEESNQEDVTNTVKILANSVGILQSNIIDKVTYSVKGSSISHLSATMQARIFDMLTPKDRQSFAKTSKAHLLSLVQYHNDLITDMLKTFGLEPEDFMSALGGSQGIITGSFALQPLLSKKDRFFINNIDIVMSFDCLQPFQAMLLLHGYNLITPYTPFLSYNPVICDRLVFQEPNTDLSINILIVQDQHSPLESIFYQPTTAMMNAITSNTIFSAYPALLKHKISLHNPWIAFKQNRNNLVLGRVAAEHFSSIIQEKYASRGFLTTADLHHIATNDNIKLLKHRCHIDPVCPLTPRGVRDRGCIAWPLFNCKKPATDDGMHYLIPGINFDQVTPQLDAIYWTVGAGACGLPKDARPSALVSYQSTFFS